MAAVLSSVVEYTPYPMIILWISSYVYYLQEKNKHICCRASNIILITFSLVQWSSNFCATAPNK